MAYKARRRPSWRIDQRYTPRVRYSAAFVTRLLDACRAPTIRIPDAIDLTTCFRLSWDQAVALDPTYSVRNEAPLRDGMVVVIKIPQRIEGCHIPPGSKGVIVGCDAGSETYWVQFCEVSDPMAFKRNELEPVLR
jgi:hypothetical protein